MTVSPLLLRSGLVRSSFVLAGLVLTRVKVKDSCGKQPALFTPWQINHYNKSTPK